jgi:inosine triphosphate pyrophosphatase
MIKLDSKLHFQIITNDVDLPEYQGDPDEVARAKSELAAKEVKGPLITEDTCLCFNCSQNTILQ